MIILLNYTHSYIFFTKYLSIPFVSLIFNNPNVDFTNLKTHDLQEVSHSISYNHLLHDVTDLKTNLALKYFFLLSLNNEIIEPTDKDNQLGKP